MATPRFVAVVDIGKTNAKLVLHDLELGWDVFAKTRPNRVLPGPPYPHFDAEGLFDFLIEALKRCANEHPMDAISVTTHGACAALVTEAGDLALPILDYEAAEPDTLAREYDALRSPFSETFSPRLPGGLNIGAQLFWLEKHFPEAFANARHILTYPQYWVYRLTGVALSEVTSLGCHTDLWNPADGCFSRLADDRGWTAKFPPVRSAFDIAGTLTPELTERVGLGTRAVPVHVGLHDSNASLLPHLLSGSVPLSVVSTGTWVVAFAAGGDLAKLEPARDMLANVDAFGRPVASARFMGGREFDLLTGKVAAEPSEAEMRRILETPVLALPSFIPGTGPFPQGEGRTSVPLGDLAPGERTALASLYVALMTAQVLGDMGAVGRTVVEGPFARNRLYLQALAEATGRPVVASPHATGTSAGAALLAAGIGRPSNLPNLPAENGVGIDLALLRRYREAWMASLAAEAPTA